MRTTTTTLQAEQDDHTLQSAALIEDVELQMHIAAGGELDDFMEQLLGVAFGYPGSATLFEHCDYGITSNSRIVLLGENGKCSASWTSGSTSMSFYDRN